MKYIKQLDSLRGLAVVLVVFSHWMPNDSLFNTYPNRPFDVDFFFVLSGYLITNILLISRNKAEELGISKNLVFKNFFLRRAIRIFPAYYLCVFIIVAFHLTDVIRTDIRHELIYCLTYTINLYFWDLKYWGDLTTHFWTLAVEEQFYLIWPWVILLVKKEYVLYPIIGFILLGFVSQCMITDMEFGYLPTNTCFDSFGIGGLISWITIYRPQYIPRMHKIFRVLALTSLALFFIVILTGNTVFIAPQRTLRSFMVAWVIVYIIYKADTSQFKLAFLFNNGVLVFLGKISYGIYLYHLFLPWDLQLLDNTINKYLPASALKYINYIYFAENITLLILISWLSYQYFEKPINGLKRYFVYTKKEPEVQKVLRVGVS
jgi:peptidoglycan/LPS O-acetylase OafA/YrhL